MISVGEMKALEDKSEQLGVSKLQLMENAGRSIFNVLKKQIELKDKKILIVCYHGNNGGDGFVAARYLCVVADITVLFVGDESKFKEEAKPNYRRLEKNDLIQLLLNAEDIDFDDFDIIIDALLGTGVIGHLKEPIAALINQINSTKAFKVSVDVPSGVDPDTGVIADVAIKPDLIVTFHDLKPGLNELKDKSVIVDIGIPKELTSKQI